jgi:Tfp pilus assembly protein PilE
MRFDWVNILATVIFVSIVVTLILAVASYFAYKVREARRPRSASELRRDGQTDKRFFEEYRPGAATTTTATAPKTAVSTRDTEGPSPINAASKQ